MEDNRKYCAPLHAGCFALAWAFALSIGYSICTLLLHYYPETSLKLKAALLHLKNTDLLSSNLEVSLNGYMQGVAQVFVYTLLLTWLFAHIYNRIEAHCRQYKA